MYSAVCFVFAGIAALAAPLYIVAAGDALTARDVPWLLRAQTLGALAAAAIRRLRSVERGAQARPA